MTTGERMKARRKELGLTGDQVAERVGISRSTIFRYENGDIEKVPTNTLVPIARVLCTTVGYLMGWEDDRSPAQGKEGGTEAEAMHYFESLPENKREEALNYLRYLASSEDKK